MAENNSLALRIVRSRTDQESNRANPLPVRGSNPVGEVYAETTFVIGQGARIPGVAYVSNSRLTDADRDQIASFAPDLAIEVISKTETIEYTERKVRDYFAAGVLEVWQVFPGLSLVRVRTPGMLQDFEGAQLLESSVLPDLHLPVDQLFVSK